MERIRIAADDAGQRLDRFLRKYLKGAALPTIYKLIRTRQVTLNGKRAKPRRRLQEGDELILHPARRRMADLRGPERGPRPEGAPALDVLYEDEHVLAVAKPPFLLVHAGRKEDEPTLLDSILEHCGPSGARTFEPNLAHRIDRLTSGVVLAGKSAEGLRGLTKAFKRKKVTKLYLTLVRGEVAGEAGEIDAPIARRDLFSGDRLKVEVARDGKPARTLYRVLRRHAGLTLLEARPTTGRTHQIRAHLRHEGHPVAGDPVYGDRALNEALRGRHGLWRQWLHAWRVDLVHPVTGEGLDLVAPLPEDLRKVLEGEGFDRDDLPDGAWKA